MTWPLTPLTTYLPGQLPAIKAADLNAIQDAINRAFRGTYSFVGLVIDEIGGNNVTPPAGGIQASGNANIGGNLQCGEISAGGYIATAGNIRVGANALSTALPTPPIAKGSLYGDACPIALASISGNGTLRVGFGIQSIKVSGPGIFDITLQLSSQALIPIACGAITGNGVFASAIGTSNNAVRVQTYETSFSISAPFAMDFFLIVYGQ